MHAKRTLIWLVPVAAAIVACALWSYLDYRAVNLRYPLGLSLAGAQARTHASYKVLPTDALSDATATDEDRRTRSFHELVVEGDGPILEFNYYDELMRVRWSGPPPLRLIEKLWASISSK